MPRVLRLSLILALALAGVEGMAWWWMHPAPSGLGEPVLQYHLTTRPLSGDDPDNTPVVTILPEVVASSIKGLHCSTGNVAMLAFPGGITIHLAFFGWDPADTTNPLQAFRHLPEVCLGRIGMTLVEKLPPHTVRVGDATLTFDHTVLRDPAGFPVHAFKSVWVSGTAPLIQADYRTSVGVLQFRSISAISSFISHRVRPAYARVTQGAVHGIANPDAAWHAFESAIRPGLEMKIPFTR